LAFVDVPWFSAVSTADPGRQLSRGGDESRRSSDRYRPIANSSTTPCGSAHWHSHCCRLLMAKRGKRWSARVMRTSDALDLERGVFTKPSARGVARSLKRSAEHSRRRKAAPFRSAMSMLNFEINRAGRKLPRSRRKVLEAAKGELRQLYGRKSHARKTHARTRAPKSASR
jgi:hypothetical protein